MAKDFRKEEGYYGEIRNRIRSNELFDVAKNQTNKYNGRTGHILYFKSGNPKWVYTDSSKNLKEVQWTINVINRWREGYYGD